jgi:2-oxoglutarate ferredoxin oxidoreductase subunit beta
MVLNRDIEEPLSDEQQWENELINEGAPPPEEPPSHPVEWGLRRDRLPHIWCPGCGIGTSVAGFVEAIKETEIDVNKLAVVSGIGCTGRVAGYIAADSFHTTHGRAIPFAMGLHLANPELKVVVYSGDGDLAAIGGNHLIHAARRNADLTVICVNNFNYGMTGGQGGPTTPEGARTTTTPFQAVEQPFNLPRLVASAGATYVARWTVLDLRRLRLAMVEALNHKGFSFVEVVSPCPVYYGRRNRHGEAVDELRYYRENIVIDNDAPLDELEIDFRGKLVVGKFVDKEMPTFYDKLHGELIPRAQEAMTARG